MKLLTEITKRGRKIRNSRFIKQAAFSKYQLLAFALVFATIGSYFLLHSLAAGSPTPIPAANVNGITVGGGFVEAYSHQVVRTSNNVVYIMAADDNPCQLGGTGVIHIWKGTGAQAGNSNVPTGFSEQDAANHPASAGSGSCIFSGGVTAMLLSPDLRLDSGGTIHLAYIDGNNGNVYYQTFSTATDTWGARVVVGTSALTNSGTGWPRTGQLALTLDANNVPHIVYMSSGTSNSVRYVNKVSGSWSAPATVFSGTNEFHPSMVTSLDGTLHLTWLDNSLASHSVIKYAHYSSGAWGTVETVSSGDNVVLASSSDDQGPSVTADSQNRPHVLYLDGTVSGADNYVRMRYRTTGGSWTDNTPPGGAGGASNPAGTWYSHTPQNYISSIGDEYVFLGHDVNISPGGYQYQTGGPGNNWSAYATIDPRNSTNTTAGLPGIDGSASTRFDPLRDNNNGIIDLIYYDESDGTAGYSHHATVFYKALVIDNTTPTVSISSPSGGATVSGTTTVSATASDDYSVAGVQFKLDGSPLGAEDTTSPYSISWDTTSASAGSHTLTAVARDPAGNTTTSSSVSVTVNNSNTANIWIDVDGGTCTRSASPVVYSSASACGTMAAAWAIAQGGDAIMVKGSAAGTVYSSGCDASGTKSSTVTISIADNESAWFAGQGSISGSNLKLTDNQMVAWPPTGYVSATQPGTGVANGITCGIVGISGQNIEFDNIDIWCKSQAPWTIVSGTNLCIAALTFTNGTNGFTMNGGSNGPMTDGATAPGVGKIVACGSLRTNCQNITFNQVYFHNNRKPVGDTTHTEMLKLDSGNNVLFKNNYFEHCEAGTDPNGTPYDAGCTSAVVELDNNGTSSPERIDNLTFLQNVFDTPATAMIHNGQTDNTPDHWNFYYNTILGSSSICYDAAGCTNPENIRWVGNFGYKASYGCGLAGQYFAYDFWYVGTGAGDASGQCGPTDHPSPNGTWGADHFLVSPGSPNFNETPLAGSLILDIANPPECPATDILGNARPQGSACDAGAIELTSGGGADTTPPTTAMTAPSNGASVRGSSVTVSANASDNVGVVGVQFKLDGVNLQAEDTSSPYSITWDTTGVSNGSHTLTAVARDAAGNSTTAASISVTVDNTAPTVSMTAPADGALVRGSSVAVSATASDGIGVAGVQFKLDGANLSTEDTTSPYSITWDSTTATNGSHTLSATARDAAGNTTTATNVTVTVDNSAPTVSVTAPSGGAFLKGSSVSVTANASDNVAVAGVQFKLDGVNLQTQDTTSPYGITWDTTTATNGAHTLTAVATDTAGNTTTSSGVSITVDNAAPTASISAPATGSSVKGSSVTVSATASDNVGVVGVQFKLDGTNLQAEDTTSPYSITWDSTTAVDGSHILTAVARDAAGNSTTATNVTITVDNTVPTVSVTAPSTGSTVKGSSVTVSATASDNIGVVGVQFKLDGANLSTEDTTSPYSITWDSTTATNASHTLTAVARDAAGNTTTSTSVTVTVDNSAPTVSVTAPTTGSSVKGSSVMVSATASDNVGVVGVQFKLDGANLSAEDTSNPYSVAWDTTTTTDGSHTLTAVTRDAAGNTTTATNVTVAVDNAVPTVSMTAPSDGSSLKGSTVTLSATASDNVGVVGVQFKLDGSNLQAEDTTSPYSITWDTTTATNGAHTLTAVARDAAGNTTTATSLNITVDNAAPTVSLTTPTTGSSVKGTSVAVNATASDNIAVVGVQFKLDGANLGTEDTSSPYSVVWDTTTATNASHTLTAVAHDAAGNSTTATNVTVTVDNVAPTVSMTAPANGATVSGSNVTISATASDNIGVAGVQFKLDANGSLGAEDTSSPYSIAWDTTTLANGTHTLSAIARDAAGNTTTASNITVTVDNTTPPPPDTTAPSVPANLRSADTTTTTISLAWDASTDNVGGSGLAGYHLYRNGAFITDTTQLTYTDSLLSPSTSYSYTVAAFDNANNPSAQSGALNVSTGANPPTVSLNASPGTINTGDSSSLTWSSTNATSCTASGAWSGSKATSGNQTTGALSISSIYNLSCDGAGGTANTSATVTVNSPSPPPPSNPPPSSPPVGVTGDLNGDGHVNIFDLSILLTHYSHNGTGDINGDGVVNIFDLSVLLSNYGK